MSLDATLEFKVSFESYLLFNKNTKERESVYAIVALNCSKGATAATLYARLANSLQQLLERQDFGSSRESA